MTEIRRKIKSIRNMKEDLHSIKMISQRNTEKMLDDLADFRNRICHEMSAIEYSYRSGRIRKRKDKRVANQRHHQENIGINSDSDCSESQSNDSKQMNFILKEIKNVQKKSKEMFSELKNYPEPLTDISTSLSNVHIGSRNNENFLSSTDTLASISNPDQVNILFSKQLPCGTADLQNSSRKLKGGSSNTVPVNNGKRFENENDGFTKQKIDKLTKKLKDIQTQNNELRNVNENIQNLLVKLSDLKYVDAETVEKLENVKRESQTSDASYMPQVDSEAVLKAENYQKFIRSIQITNPKNMLTKIKVAKLIIQRLRSGVNIADQEHKYKVRIRQDEQDITFKAHHHKPQSFRQSNLE